jgi:5-oxoprolinase (ATP-hydrolysing) subunit C
VTSAVIDILAVRGLATVQDAGRPGFMHEGVPPGGALVPELAACANFAVANANGAPVIEVFGGLTLTVRGARTRVAAEDGAARDLSPGEPFELSPSSSLRVRYIAVAGGLAVARVLGGRGTLAVAHLGGHQGRALEKGDRIPVGVVDPDARPLREPATLDLSAPVRVLLGPGVDRFEALAPRVLSGEPFTVLSSSDRSGTRLSGPELRRVDPDSRPSAPMVRGAIQVPASNQAIVLGPDHPTTGGYPVIAVIARADLGRFFARPVGATVRFTLVTLDEARAAVLAF